MSLKLYTHPDGTKSICPHESQIPEGMEFLLTYPDFKQKFRPLKPPVKQTSEPVVERGLYGGILVHRETVVMNF